MRDAEMQTDTAKTYEDLQLHKHARYKGLLDPIMENGGFLPNTEADQNNSPKETDSKPGPKRLTAPSIKITYDSTESLRSEGYKVLGGEDRPLGRPRSNSACASDLRALRPGPDLQIPTRKRSGSVISLPHIHHSNKIYLPVEQFRLNHNGNGAAKLVDSFADYVQVSTKLSSKKPPGVLAQQQRSRKMRRRLVYKNGDCNVTHKHIRKVRRHYLADIFTTLIDLKWRWTLIIFIIAFVLTWLLFALVWWIIGLSHGDFAENLPETHKVCMNAVYDFPSAFLFSLETQHTIGYGSRHITEECPEALVVLIIQSITGVLVQALMTGMIFAKLSRPKKRAETLMFSKNAVICLRDGQLCVMFRIGDMRSSHLIEAHVRGMVIRRRVTKEGEVLPLDHQDVNLGFDNGTDRLLIVWPVIVIHKIDENSPFWRMSRDDLERENFEMIIILEGVIESTGSTTQARTSYLPGEILWGHRLERLVTFQKEGGEYQVDYSRFENTVPVDTPSVSPKELAVMSPDSESDDSNGQEFTLLRADSVQTSDAEESDVMLIPDGATAVRMHKLSPNGDDRESI